MAKYTATERVWVNNTLIEPGVEFSSDATPGKHWAEVGSEPAPEPEPEKEPEPAKEPEPKAEKPKLSPKTEPALA